MKHVACAARDTNILGGMTIGYRIEKRLRSPYDI